MIEKGFWITTSLFFGLLLSQGSWAMAAAILGLLLYVVLLIGGLQPMAVLLLMGPATFFVFLNSYLNAIPIITMERLIFASMLGLILLKDCFNKKSRIKLAPIEVLMICFLFYTLLSLLSTFNDKPLSVWIKMNLSLYLQGYFMPMVCFMIARRLIWDQKSIGILFKILIVAGTFLGITSILQIYFGVTAFIPDYMDLGINGRGRARGTFTNTSEYGLVMSAFILIGGLVYARTKNLTPKMLLLGCLALMLVGLFLCKTRAPWLGAIVSLAFVTYHDKRIQPLMLTMAGIGILASTAILPFMIDFNSIISRITDVVPILNRLSVWGAGLNMMIQNPVFGIGLGRGSFGGLIHEYAFNFGPVSSQWAVGISVSHNEFLFIAAHTGILGIIIYLSIFWHILQMLRKTYKNPSSSQFEKDLALYMGGIFICFIINGLLVDIGIFNYFFTLMYFLFGIVAASSLKYQAREHAREPVLVS
jgi:O-antigen ligase